MPPTRPQTVPATRFDQHDVVVAGMRLRYVDVAPTAVAEPDDVLLVIPGHTAHIEGYDDLVDGLSERHRVLVVDLPGSGWSDHPVRRYDLGFYEDTIAGFLDALGLDHVVPVGGSLGGNLVLRLGHRWPERFPRLVCWAPGGGWRAKPRLAAVTRAVMGRWSFWPSVRIQSRYWYADDFPGKQQALDETFAYYREVMGPGFVAMYWGIAADQLAHSLFDIAPEIRQPTILLWGDQDHGAGMGRGVARIHSLLPDSRLHVFEGARHSVETEIPAALAAAIIEFLADTAPG